MCGWIFLASVCVRARVSVYICKVSGSTLGSHETRTASPEQLGQPDRVAKRPPGTGSSPAQNHCPTRFSLPPPLITAISLTVLAF